MGKTSRPKRNWGWGSLPFCDCAESPPSPPPGTETINKKNNRLATAADPNAQAQHSSRRHRNQLPRPLVAGRRLHDSQHHYRALFLPSRPDERPVVRRRAKEHRAKLRLDRRHDSAMVRCGEIKLARRDEDRSKAH